RRIAAFPWPRARKPVSPVMSGAVPRTVRPGVPGSRRTAARGAARAKAPQSVHGRAPTRGARFLPPHNPRFAEPLLRKTPLPLSGAQVEAMYQDRWPVEGLPLWAKQMLGAARPCVCAPASGQRLPAVALLAGSILAYTAATQPALSMGFWDRIPRYRWPV